MRVFVVTIPFTVERRVFSSLVTRDFAKDDTIHVYPANNLPDSEGKYWLDFHQSAENEDDCVFFDDCYGHLIDISDLERCCTEM